MWRIVLAAPLLVHGLAHISGFITSWTTKDAGFKKRPWIFTTGVELERGIGRAFGILWLIAMIGFIGTAIGVLFRQDWWIQLAIGASATSLVVIVPWWNTVPPGAKVGAVFDLVVVVGLLLPLKQRIVDLLA